MAATVVIPARFASSRFPAKIIASQTGKPLVQHVVERVLLAKSVSRIIVAADDRRIADALQPFGTECIMTAVDHPSGTDRIAEVARSLAGPDADIIVNVQGDEPEIEPQTIDGLIARLQTSDDPMATAATPFTAGADVRDENLVKVVMDTAGRALYFSRSPIPHLRQGARHEESPGDTAYYLHLGIYAYRRPFLLEYAAWPPTPLEMTEMLEQLRVLEHGRSIYVLRVEHATHGIDTPAQYAEFVKRYKKISSAAAARQIQ